MKFSEGILFTDFYQLTMAQLYFKQGLHQKKAQFEYFFRKYPTYDSHQAGYCIACGLQPLVEWMDKVSFQKEDVEALAGHKAAGNKPLFQKDFLDWLVSCGNFGEVSLEAVPEGRVVHPEVPLVAASGPLAITQILETALLNYLNYQTLVATKACRIKEAGKGNLLLDFGLRRAQARGGNLGTRAALIGGADFSSNTGVSYELGFLPKGTHAHSMVQAFIALGYSELDAFDAYAKLYPENCLLLVDTIDTLGSGLPNAIKVFQTLTKKGYQPLGIRLDSGDLAYLSIQAVKMLDEAGFKKTKIVLSNKLDELVVWQIITQIQQEASRYRVDADNLIKRLVYGVGTNLITSKGCPALDGVYKLAAISGKKEFQPAFKFSETPAKISNPGKKSAWRLYDERNKAVADVLSRKKENLLEKEKITLYHPSQEKKRKIEKKDIAKIENLHEKITEKGKIVYDFPAIDSIRKTRIRDLELLDLGVKRLINPHRYHVSLSQGLWELKKESINKKAGGNSN